MADITAKLIWYRLRENYESLAQSYEEFSWRRVDILDMLFLGWVLGAFLVVGFVNLYLRFFGLPNAFKRRPVYGGGHGRIVDGQVGSSANSGGHRGGETVNWINAAIQWLIENCQHKPEFIESCLRTLSEEAKKYTERDVQIRFDGLQAGNVPLQFANVSTDVQDKSTLTVLTNVTCTDATLLVSVVTKAATHMQTTGCQVRIVKLYGPIKIQYKSHGSEGQLLLSFHATPELKLHVSPNSYSKSIDQQMIESVVQKAISKVVLQLSFPDAGSLETISHSLLGSQATRASSSPSSAFGCIEGVGSEAAVPSNALGTAKLEQIAIGSYQTSPKTGRRANLPDNPANQTLRLLVKLIKANGLMDKDFTSCDPFCLVFADEPAQQFSTSVVKNTINPFFDEYFLLDVNNKTKQIKFEVYDRSKAKGENFLGQAHVVLDDLKNVPSSRQIIPLTGRPKASTSTSGSITVEFLFLEANDAMSSKSLALEPSPPRRRIELNRAMMPGGMTVTTKTTTTERLRDQKEDPLKYNGSPTRVEKAETVSSYVSDSSPYLSGASSRTGNTSSAPSSSQDQILTNGTDSLTETALRQLSRQPQAQSQSTTIVITGIQKEHSNPSVKEHLIPTITMTRSPSLKQLKDTASSVGSERPAETKKKSFASALKKRFTRSKKSRSHSADRAQTFRDESLLRPTEEQGNSTTGDQSDFSEGTLRKSRSHSFSSSLRSLFRRKKKNMSRESSMSRISMRGAENSREDSIIQPSPQLPLPKGSIARHNTPVAEFSPTTSYPYSTSVPARPSPLYDH